MVRGLFALLRRTIFLFPFLGVVAAQIVIIVHPDNPIQSITREQLEHLYNGTLTQFPDGTTVTLVEHKPTAETFYQTLLNKSYIKIKKQWIRYVFSGRTANPPEEISNTTKLQEFVLANRGAIAFLPYEDIDAPVKIIAIDDHRIHDKDYLFSIAAKVTDKP